MRYDLFRNSFNNLTEVIHGVIKRSGEKVVCVFENGDRGGGDAGEIKKGEIGMSEKKDEKFYWTVTQLVKILQTLPQDLPVLVSGYEGGYENFYEPVVSKLKHEPQNPYFEGEFQIAENGDKDTFDGVVLGRILRND